ncbi:MAG: hypothetical protein JWQ75_2071 [Pseudarthrobacter sp.]|nr:hypothetical protein [Pseudarthrobacter sp.]
MTPSWRGSRPSAAARGLAGAAALLLAGSLAACGPANSGLQRDAARQLQQRVIDVSHAAAGNDPSGGLAALDYLEAELATAVGNGQVSEDRRRSIMTAAAAVRADLAAIQATADAAAAAAAATSARAAEEAAAAPASSPEAQAPASSEAAKPAVDKGNEGKAKGKD